MTPERSGEEPKYDCDTCHRTFQFQRHYLKHMQVHKETPFDKNSEYVAACNSNIQCLDHLRTHEQESTLKCMYCSESLSSPDTRRVHENNHTRGNPFICEVCHKKYETKGSLQRHLLLHGSERLINSGEKDIGKSTKYGFFQTRKLTFSCHNKNDSVIIVSSRRDRL
ncbi:hypothetical protein TNCT_609001 [Trichonephila clavata]|uniref:C2H2-type domain-containing protein n=1 Tax=Trichonephila clavata TaxID=2740835 RepID=A0A8X6KBT9_TRICU|nr:hypothetical protein TNCT_609001 [Trichonephila clavata]